MKTLSFKSFAGPRNRRGFTAIELIIVVVIIGILAAITSVVYSGLTKRAVETAMQSDLDTGSSALELDNRQNGSYPLSAVSANGGQGLAYSPGNALTYVSKSDGYCLSVTNAGTTSTFAYRSSTRTIQSGTCDHVVSTLAGSGVASFADGTGASAQFNGPYGIVVDASGNVYVGDASNHRIRMISPNGVVTTLAGSATAGSLDGTGASAQFNNPRGVAIDTSGTVYVADTFNNLIRKIAPGGVVTTFAGSGVYGFADGTGTSAQFKSPYAVAVDTSFNVYVAEPINNRIRKITPGGVVSTLAGSDTLGFVDGPIASAQFQNPYGVAVDTSGNVYVADTFNNRIRKITPGGVVSTLAGSNVSGFADGTGTSAQFNAPYGVAVDTSGNVYVGDSYYQRIRKITASGVVTTLAGSTQGYTDGIGASAQFFGPKYVAVDAAGTIYVADQNNNRIRKITTPF